MLRRERSTNCSRQLAFLMASRFTRGDWQASLFFLGSHFARGNLWTGLFFSASRMARGNSWTGLFFLGSRFARGNWWTGLFFLGSRFARGNLLTRLLSRHIGLPRKGLKVIRFCTEMPKNTLWFGVKWPQEPLFRNHVSKSFILIYYLTWVRPESNFNVYNVISNHFCKLTFCRISKKKFFFEKFWSL